MGGRRGSSAGPFESTELRHSAMEKGVFTLLYCLCKDVSIPPILAHVITFIEDLQLLSFSWIPQVYSTVPHVLEWILSPLSFVGIKYTYLQVFSWLFIGILFCTIALTAFVGYCFKTGTFKYIWPLILLRGLTILITTVLFIPGLELIVKALLCQKQPDGVYYLILFPDQPLFASHLPLFAFSLVAGVILLPYGLLVNVLYVDSEPASKDPTAKAHGLIDALYFISKTILVLTLFASPTAQLIASLILTIILGYSYLRYQPYYNSETNQQRIGMITAAIVSSIIALITWATQSPDSSSIAPIICSAIGSVIGFIVGWFATMAVKERIIRRVTACVAEKIRMGGEVGTETQGSLLRKGKVGQQGMTVSIVASARADDTIKHGSATEGGIPDGVDALEEGVHDRDEDALKLVNNFSRIRKTKAVRVPVIFSSPTEADICCRFLRTAEVTNEAITLMKMIFCEALAQYPKNAQLALMYASYLSEWGKDADLARYYVQVAKSAEPNIAIRFRIFTEERQIEQGEFDGVSNDSPFVHNIFLRVLCLAGTGLRAASLEKSSLNIASFVEYQSMERQALDLHLASLMAMKHFWLFLNGDNRDPVLLAKHLDLMSSTQDKASQAYEKLTKRFPKSKKDLRMYAKYLITLKNNQDLGAQLLTRAEDIEHQERSASMGFMGSNMQSVDQIPEPDFPLRSRQSSNRPDGRKMSFSLHPNIREESEVFERVRHSEASGRDVEDGRGDGGMERSLSLSRSVDAPQLVGKIFKETSSARGASEAGGGGDWKMRDGDHRASIVRVGSYDAGYDGGGGVGNLLGKAGIRGPRSIASSSASNKESRRLKTQHAKLLRNLLGPLLRFEVYVRLCCLVLLGLLVAIYVVSQSLFDAPNSFLQTMQDTTRGRRRVMEGAMEIRQLQVWGGLNNTAVWNYHHTKLKGVADRFNKTITPGVFPNANDPPTAWIMRPVSDGLNPALEIMTFNAYTMAQFVTAMLIQVWNYGFNMWNSTNIQSDRVIRLWFDNSLQLGTWFNQFATDGFSTYKSIQTKRNIQVGVLLAIALINVIFTTAFMYLTLRHGYAKQRTVLKALAKLPRADRRKIVDDLDEEIEDLFEFDENGERVELRNVVQTVEARSDWAKIRDGMMYGSALIILAALCAALFVPPLIYAQNTDELASIMKYSNDRRFYCQNIIYLAGELIAQDRITWAPYQVHKELFYNVHMLSEAHEAVMSGSGAVPSTNLIPQLAGITRGGQCISSLGCTTRPFNDSIGFNAGLLMSGADNLVYVFLDHAKSLLEADPSNLTWSNTDYFYLVNLESDIQDGLLTAGDILLSVSRATSTTFIRAVNILFAFTIIYFAAFYVFAFVMILKGGRRQIGQLVSLIFWIPQEIVAKSAEVRKFIDSGGVEEVEEKVDK
ncbi:hypothetical protein HDV00_003326 [Rhizophlyctis rosea]|nr:hypothetical protein HDV00_003326 [Rhizophlyctis rosea]